MKTKSFSKLQFEDLIIADHETYSIVNKPPFLSCLEDRFDSVNLLSLAKSTNPEYQICHRIDKETSGIVVFAKTPEAYRNFAIQLEDREVKKIYHAIIDSIQKIEDFEANEPLFTTSNRSRVDFKRGKPSLTLFQTLEIFKKHSLIKCFPVSGRMHQIRVHLTYHGWPISNDQIYGGSIPLLSSIKKKYHHKEEQEERAMISRVALHAYEIAFKNLNGEVINGIAPYPKDLQTFIDQLKKYK